MIRLSILGPTTCLGPSGDDLPGVARSGKRLALLAYLAAARPRGAHRRDTLLGLFWAESDQARARASLRQALRHLRSELGDAVISRGSEEVGLDWSRFWCDAAAFTDLLDVGRPEDALELYRRDLLEGLFVSGAPAFEDWLDRERTALKRRGATAAWQLADEAEHAIDAARWARRAVAFTPLDEVAIRRLMTLLDERGDATGALREYERFETRVRRELEVTPGPETRSLVDAIRARARAPLPGRAFDESGSIRESGQPDIAAGAEPGPGAGSGGGPSEAVPAVQTAGDASARASRQRRRPIRVVAAVVTIGLAGAAGLPRLLSDDTRPVFRLGSATRITDFDGREVMPSLAPGSDRVAYVAGPAGETRIYVMRPTGGRPVPLSVGLEGAHHSPVWSPDGEQLVFTVLMPDNSKQLVLSASTGGRTRILAAAESGVDFAGSSWSPSGDRIVFSRDRRLTILDIETGEETDLGTAWAPHSMAWSPDGQFIAFVSENSEFRLRANIAPSSIWVMPAVGGAPIPVTPEAGTDQSPVWLPDSRTLLFVSDRDGTPDIFQVVLGGDGRPLSDPKRITAGLNALSIHLSDDGRRLVYAKSAGLDTDIFAVERGPDGGVLSLDDAVRVTSGNQVIETLSLSPDGRLIAFDSNREGNQDIYVVSASGGEPVRITRDPAHDFAPRWSPDGTEIVYYSFRNGKRDIYVADVNGSRHERVTDESGSAAFPDWSPDGSQIVLQHNPDDTVGNRTRIVTVSRQNATTWGDLTPITTDDGAIPRWSPDGRWIAYHAPEGVSVIDVATLENRVLFGNAYLKGAPVWSSDSESLLIAATSDGVTGIWDVRRRDGARRLVASAGEVPLGALWFDSDGHRIIFRRDESAEVDIWIADLESGR